MPLFPWPTSGESRSIAVTIPTIAIGATSDQVIVWSTPMPDANYVVQCTIESGTANIGKVTAGLKQGTLAPEGCTVTVANALLVSLSAGSRLHVTAQQVTN